MTRLTVVTGGSRGIGAAICTRLARDGHDVIVGFRTDAAAAEAVAVTVRESGRRALTMPVDTANAASIDAFFDAADDFGPVTGFVNNAAVSGPVGRLEDADVDGLRAAIDVNFLGYLLCARRAIRSLKRTGSGAAIVQVSSAAAAGGSPGMYVHYAAAKSAVETLTVGLARELATDGIRVNAVAPGIIRTEFHLDPERPDKLAATIPMGRPGLPEEIAGAVAWLLSDDAGYATGAVLRVAGGM